MEQTKLTPSGKPFDIHERLLLFACDIVRLTQFLHTRGPIARRLSYQILDAGTSVGPNAEEADGASSHDDFIAKNRIALKEAKETRFRPPRLREQARVVKTLTIEPLNIAHSLSIEH
jgi:four helix bundle protein